MDKPLSKTSAGDQASHVIEHLGATNPEKRPDIVQFFLPNETKPDRKKLNWSGAFPLNDVAQKSFVKAGVCKAETISLSARDGVDFKQPATDYSETVKVVADFITQWGYAKSSRLAPNNKGVVVTFSVRPTAVKQATFMGNDH